MKRDERDVMKRRGMSQTGFWRCSFVIKWFLWLINTRKNFSVVFSQSGLPYSTVFLTKFIFEIE